MSERVTCPACAAETLSEAGVGEVCAVCGWADEAALRTAPEREGGGGVSLEEARRNFEAFGSAYPPSEVGGS